MSFRAAFVVSLTLSAGVPLSARAEDAGSPPDGGVVVEATPTPKVEPKAWTVVAVGDVNLGTAWPSAADLPPDGAKTFFDQVKPLLKPSDLTYGNLETVLADTGASHKCGRRSGHCFAFRVPARYADALEGAGFDAMSLSNNHAGDFGPEGRAATRAALDRTKVRYAGPDDVRSLEIDGRKVALITFSFGSEGHRIQDLPAGARLVADAAKTHDLVVVGFHAGAEGRGADHVKRGAEMFLGENRGDSRAFAHAMVDAGASLLLGSGPHVLRGMEIYRGHLIAYSLGNFSAWNTFALSGASQISGVLHATLAADGTVNEIQFDPVALEKPGRPGPDSERRAIAIVQRLSKSDFGAALLDDEGRWKRVRP